MTVGPRLSRGRAANSSGVRLKKKGTGISPAAGGGPPGPPAGNPGGGAPVGSCVGNPWGGGAPDEKPGKLALGKADGIADGSMVDIVGYCGCRLNEQGN